MHHAFGQVGDAGDVDQRLHRRFPHQGQGALGDVDGQIAHALQVVVDLDDGGDESQVARHGLEQGQHAGGQLVDLNLLLVDQRLVPHHLLGLVFVAIHQRQNAVVDRGLDQAAHFEQFALQLFELFAKMKHRVFLRRAFGSHLVYPKRPVM